MSVEKFIVTKEDSHYTIIPNNIIRFFQNDLRLLGFWVSLSSLPHNWEFHKSKMMSDFKLGRDKLNKYLALLEKCNLIKLSQVRNIDGTFGDGNLHIKSGRDFIPFTENQSTANQPFTDLPYTASQSLVTSNWIQPPIKEIVEKKEKKEIKNKQKSFYKTDNEKKHDFANSMDQMANEQKHIEEHEKIKLAERHPDISPQIKEMTRKLRMGMTV